LLGGFFTNLQESNNSNKRNNSSSILFQNATVSELLMSRKAFLITGSISSRSFGMSVAGIGDFNGDDYDDIAVSSLVRSSGLIYIIFGASSSTLQNIEIDSFTASMGVKIFSSVSSYAGISLSHVGDVNGDGFDDMLIGSVPYTNGFQNGIGYLLYGRNDGVSSINLVILSSKDGLSMNGGGIVVGNTGDINQDGYADMIFVNYKPMVSQVNTYLFVYPMSPSLSPTLSPVYSRKPSIIPSLRPIVPSTTPSYIPSMISSFPSPLPSLEPTILSLPPTTTYPTYNPSILKTRIPTTTSPSYRFFRTNQPTFLNTLQPTIHYQQIIILDTTTKTSNNNNNSNNKD
jgi:hypothetical protein